MTRGFRPPTLATSIVSSSSTIAESAQPQRRLIFSASGTGVEGRTVRSTRMVKVATSCEHLAAAAHNLKPGRKDPPKLEQSAFSQGLSAEQVAQLQLLARQLWSDALRQFLQMATVAEQRSDLPDWDDER